MLTPSKKKIFEGLSNYGIVKEICYDEHPLLPGFLGHRAYVELIYDPSKKITKGMIPSRMFIPSAQDEFFNLKIEGKKFNNNKEPVLVGTIVPTQQRNLSTPRSTTLDHSVTPMEVTSSPHPDSINQYNANPSSHFDNYSEISNASNALEASSSAHNSGISQPINNPDEINLENEIPSDFEMDPTEYPILPNGISEKNLNLIYSNRANVLDEVHQYKVNFVKLVEHKQKYDPPHKSTVTRFQNLLKNNKNKVNQAMDLYWSALTQVTNNPEAADPEILEEVSHCNSKILNNELI